MRRSQLASQFGVSQTLVEHLAYEFATSLPIAIRFAIVEPKGLLIQIAEQMEGFDADIGSFQAPLQQIPEAFQIVSVDIAVNVFDRVIDNRVLVVGFQAS